MEESALENNIKGLDPNKVVNTISKIIQTDNPKPTYNVGYKSSLVQLFSILPLWLINKIIKIKLKKSN